MNTDGSRGRHFTKGPGKHYNYFRDYDSAVGRYLQSDPIGLSGGLNTYAYVYSKPLSLVDRDGLAAGPAYEPDPDYGWKPEPRDKYPGPAPDAPCMVLCIVLKTAAGTGLGETTRATGNFLKGSPSAGLRVAGAIGSFGATAIGRTGTGQVVGAGITMTACEALCRKPSYCEIPSWAGPYQNMPLPLPFPR